MSLLWRRAAIAGFVLLGLGAAAAGLWRGLADPINLAWIASGTVLSAGALLLFDGRRFSHAVLFSAIAGLTAASIGLHLQTPIGWLGAVLATIATLCSAVAWVTRERQPEPTLGDYYAAAVKARRIRKNAAQLALVEQLDALRLEFRRYERRRRMPWAFLLRPPQGIYLHGAAGQGKSFLLDGMFDTAPTRAKHRFHFHDLVSGLSDALNAPDTRAMRPAARSLVDRASLVMIDEVNVLDPATALLFMRLMQVWWRYGCVICISSNQSPHQLFKGVPVSADELSAFFTGLERHTFIEMLDAGADYRLQKLSGRDLYQYPIDEGTAQRMEEIVHLLAESELRTTGLKVNGRALQPIVHATGVAWFNFANLCEAPLGYRDYLTLVERYPNLVISNVPRLESEDSARRFAWLVEIFYDRRKRLILAAHAEVQNLFAPALSSLGRDVDFVKIQSRLIEMQSSEYEYTLV